MSQSMKALQAMLTEGISLTEAANRFGVSKAAVSKAKLHPSKKSEMTQTIEQLQAKVAELEAENARLRTVPMKYRRMAFNAQLQDENKELRAQLAAVQEEIERLRIALDCTKTDLVRMRCPDFFEGVKDGYEILFDGHLVNMIGIINDYAKQK